MIVDPATAPREAAPNGGATLFPSTAGGLTQFGACVCWPKGVANAHCLENRSGAPVLDLVIGTRWPEDAVTCPDVDLHYRRAGGWRHLTRKDGTPLPGWPKETNR
jgi:uncharacterized cupin superfamily protein